MQFASILSPLSRVAPLSPKSSSLRILQSVCSASRRQARGSPGTALAMSSKSELLSQPGVAKSRDPATDGFVFQQTMYRIKDSKRSLDFYTRILGMRLLCKLDFPEMKFSLIFLGYREDAEIPDDSKDRVEWMFNKEACLELTHNWGTEDDDSYKAHNGNEEPKGYGHIGLSVPDVYAACKRFEELGVDFVKKPDDGKMKGLAFIKDPDGYWIEILNAKASRVFG
ncbi:hypothetical protein WJX73_002729 [Symbiochloris irregularis]|uniref:Lactoylglutathione lyase n=1 Tax=Symbiochloris irregularis TaxID=706552 RepID=A0AAW1PMC9_9CHLO